MSIEEWGPGKHSEKGNMAHIGIFKLGMCIFTHICIFYVYYINHHGYTIFIHIVLYIYTFNFTKELIHVQDIYNPQFLTEY
jgi:hypothetical protein